MIKKYFLAFTSLILLLLAHNAFSDDGMGNIRIIINDFNTTEPVAGAEILITPCDYTGTTDSSGEAIIEQVVPLRNYKIEVKADGYIDAAVGFVSVEGEKETVSIIPLKQKATLTGHVAMQLFFGFFQWPLGNAEVQLQGKIDQSFATVGEVQTDFWGRYNFENLDEGTYRIYAQAEGFARKFVDFEVKAGQENVQNFILLWQWDNNTNKTITLTMNESLERFLDTDDQGINDNTTNKNFQIFNSAPEAVLSVIPGPSELPYLYNDHQILASTSGSRFVDAGATVYLRGFAIDQDLPSPLEFNPGAPCFDIYGNKNGDFSASIFSYSWSLKDEDGKDYSSLLTPSPATENVWFDLPEDFQTGDYLIASLTVTGDQGMESDPEEITIVVAERVDEAICSGCHNGPDDPPATYPSTQHAQVQGGATCQDCHGLGSEHPNTAGKLTVSYWSGTCGQCHIEFAELQKANHSDPLPYGYYEPDEGLLTVCYRCHYTLGYIGAVESGKDFHQFSYGLDVLAIIPKDSPNVSCANCHDPHLAGDENPYGLRTGNVGTACDTCHYEKWQNTTLEGIADVIGNGYHYPGKDYTPFLGENNPHRTEDKCVLCHMNETLAAKDENGVLKIGGHTFRMRDFGTDKIPDTGDDILNIAACQECHVGVSNFDIGGVQTEVEGLLSELSNLLTGNNHGFLPANEPGNCSRCHKGGTVPFLDDPDNVLENAYTNYRLILHDRSRGIHNIGYITKLLQDSIDSIQNDYKP